MAIQTLLDKRAMGYMEILRGDEKEVAQPSPKMHLYTGENIYKYIIPCFRLYTGENT